MFERQRISTHLRSLDQASDSVDCALRIPEPANLALAGLGAALLLVLSRLNAKRPNCSHSDAGRTRYSHSGLHKTGTATLAPFPKNCWPEAPRRVGDPDCQAL
jgi:hypothetical protein